MGLCLCTHIFDNDDELSQSQLFARDCAVLRSKIQARKMPVIWMSGDENAVNLHSANVAEKFGFSVLNANKISKNESLKDTSKGKIVKAKIAQGKKVPDRVMVDLMKEAMILAGDTRGYILIGFPSSIKQALLFTREMSPADCVLLLQHATPTVSPEKETPTPLCTLSPLSPLSFPFSVPANSPITPPGDKDRQQSQSQPASPQTSTYQHEIHQIQHSLQQIHQQQYSPPTASPGGAMLKGDSKEVNKRLKNMSDRKRRRQKDKELERESDRETDTTKMKEGDRVKDLEKEKEKEEEEIKEIIECTGAKPELILEKINASEAASDIFLKIEAAILDRTSSNV